MLSRKSFFSILIIIFLFSSFLFVNIKVLPVYATTTYLSSNFESFPTGFTAAGIPFIPAKSGEQYHAGAYSAVCNSSIITQYSYFTTTFSSITGALHFSIWIYPDNSNPSEDTIGDFGMTILSGYNGSAYGVITKLNYTGSIYNVGNQKIGGGWDIVGNITGNSWHQIEIYQATQTSKLHYYIDGLNASSSYTPFGWNNQPTTTYLGDPSGAYEKGKIFYDDISYDNISEPTHSAPQYDSSKTATNSTDTISDWKFSTYWYQITDTLSGYIFSFNASSILVNDTWITSPATNNTWINITKTISNNVGNTIQWIVYVNSSYNVWNSTIVNTIVTATITFYFSSNGILEKNGTSITNSSSVTYNTLSPVIHLSGVPTSGIAFMNFTISGTLIVNNPYNFTVQNSTSIWCNFKNISFIIARFSLNNSAPYQNETLFYNGTLSSSSSNIISFDWNFGDGNSATGNTTTHKYALDGIYLVNLTVSSGSMIDTMLQNITVSATTLTITGLDGTFALLMILLTVCLVLCVFRVPLIGFVFSLFTVSFSAWALTDTLLPLYPMINVFIAVIGGICFYLNIQKFRESNVTKKNTSKLARRF